MDTNEIIKSVLSENIVETKKQATELLMQKLSERLQAKFDEFAPFNFLDEETLEEKMDPVGEEDEDVNNDGEVDEQDDYLKHRREAIGDAIEGEDEEDEDEGDEGEEKESKHSKKHGKKHKKHEEQEGEDEEDEQGEYGNYEEGEYGSHECEGGDCYGNEDSHTHMTSMGDESNNADQQNRAAFHRVNENKNPYLNTRKSKKGK